MIISSHAETAFDKIQYHFMIIVQERQGVQRTHFNIIKAIYSQPIANTILKGKKLKAFPVKLGATHEFPVSPYIFNIALEVSATVTK